MTIARLWSKMTADKTRYSKDEIETSKQAQAARNVQAIEYEVQQAADAFRSIKEQDKDCVYGTISCPNGFGGRYFREGSCKFDASGEVVKMNVDDGSLTVEKRGDHKEICSKSYLHGSGRDGSDTQITEQWITMDGNSVSFKEFSYWLGY